MRLKTAVVFLVLGLAFALSPAFGDILAVNFDNRTAGSLGNPPFTLGWTFTVNQPITVTWLDLFDDTQDGLVESHEVGVWTTGGTLLVSATVDAGTADPLHDKFRAKAVAPTLLAPGNYNIGALFVSGNDPNLFPGDAIGFVTAPQINFVANAFMGGGALTNPTLTVSADPAYFGPNFEFNAAVPEPSAILFLGSAVVFLTGMSFRRRYASRLK